MSNSNMPAMPFINVEYDGEGKVDMYENKSGLTKLEHFAGLAIPPMDMIIEAMKQCNNDVSIDDYISYTVAYRVKEAKALLAELEKGNDS